MMMQSSSVNAQRIAALAATFQIERTGHPPGDVTVVFGDDTVVITLHEALTPSERELARTPAGAAQVRRYHRALFACARDWMCDEISRITAAAVREAAAEVEPATGTVVHVFTTGRTVQMFLLS